MIGLTIVLGANHQAIPSIADNPVQFLGRTISDALSDKCKVDSLTLALTKGLGIIGNYGHRTFQKLQHLLVPRLRWPLLIYEVPIFVVTKLEQKISCCVRKWLRLHNATTNISLYSSSSPCPLPIKSLLSIMKSVNVWVITATKVCRSLCLRNKCFTQIRQLVSFRSGERRPKRD